MISTEETIKDYNIFQKELREYTIKALNWQLISGYVILAIVFLVVATSLFLSFLEVKKSIDISKDLKENISNRSTELIISANKVQITSAITGIIMLTLSIGFLYIFSEFIFGIEFIK